MIIPEHADESEHVPTRDEKLEAAARKYYAWRVTLTTVIALSVVATLVVVLLSFGKLISLATDTHRNTDTLVNCTTPGHSCYEAGRSATSGAVGTIGKIVIAASFCVKNLDHNATQAQIQSCVNAQVN